MRLGDIRDELWAALAGVEDGHLYAEWIVEDVTGMPRLELQARWEEAIGTEATEQARAWAVRVAAGEPIQYVLGWMSFRGHRIRTDRRALIPRPETEELVSLVREGLSGPVRVADVGTGTACIAIALCLECPQASVLAVDREPDALDLAAENVSAHGLQERILLRQGDLLDGIAFDSLDVVVSNPPYVMEAEMPGLPRNVREHEPASALVAGPEGLDAIRRLIPQAYACLKPGGRLVMEIGETQAEAVAGLMRDAGFEQVFVRRDLAGRPRMVAGVRRSSQ